MKSNLYFLLFPLFFLSFSAKAQLEKVLVEKYYISDANDATDTNNLAIGSITYRIYIDMLPGYRLTKVYGDINHALKIKSTDVFFNNKTRGKSFGNEISLYGINEGTTALDTWMTIGQASQTYKNKTYFGVLKTQDTTGSIIGGLNNDGGSAGIPGGLLSNADVLAGIPLTTTDGMDTLINFPSNWFSYGFSDQSSGLDSTIFGSIKSGNEFLSNDAGLVNTGISGVDRGQNQVLVAQLTTKGTISFELNIAMQDSLNNEFKYVANDSILLGGETFSRYLTFPYQTTCGCPDPDYLEYMEDRDCDSASACITKIIFGCMDPLSCNYDPAATYSLPQLCCYPGFCNDRDIDVVCPGISNSFKFEIFPNPTSDFLTVQMLNANEELSYSVFDSFGNCMLTKNIGSVFGDYSEKVDMSTYNKGLYLMRVSHGGVSDNKLFMKN